MGQYVVIPLREACRMCTNGAWTSHRFRTLYLVKLRGIGELLLEPLDHFLAEVTALSEFLLDLLVDLDLALVCLYLLLHLVVLEDEDLGLL